MKKLLLLGMILISSIVYGQRIKDTIRLQAKSVTVCFGDDFRKMRCGNAVVSNVIFDLRGGMTIKSTECPKCTYHLKGMIIGYSDEFYSWDAIDENGRSCKFGLFFKKDYPYILVSVMTGGIILNYLTVKL